MIRHENRCFAHKSYDAVDMCGIWAYLCDVNIINN